MSPDSLPHLPRVDSQEYKFIRIHPLLHEKLKETARQHRYSQTMLIEIMLLNQFEELENE